MGVSPHVRCTLFSELSETLRGSSPVLYLFSEMQSTDLQEFSPTYFEIVEALFTHSFFPLKKIRVVFQVSGRVQLRSVYDIKFCREEALRSLFDSKSRCCRLKLISLFESIVEYSSRSIHVDRQALFFNELFLKQ